MNMFSFHSHQYLPPVLHVEKYPQWISPCSVLAWCCKWYKYINIFLQLCRVDTYYAIAWRQTKITSLWRETEIQPKANNKRLCRHILLDLQSVQNKLVQAECVHYASQIAVDTINTVISNRLLLLSVCLLFSQKDFI